MAATWKEMAAVAEAAEGYIPGNNWEALLARHLERHLPELAAELTSTGDFEAYVRARTFATMEYVEALEDQGMDPQAANELAMEQLLPRPADEEDKPEPWELEAGMDAQAQAAMNSLLSQKSQHPRTQRI